jgi:AraC-like DNA-binding protein
MAQPVDRDARGIVNPSAGLRRFRLGRVDPSPGLARFVELFWIVEWDLDDGVVHDQEVVTHPAVNLAFERWSDRPPVAQVHGVVTRRDVRRISGAGAVVGVKFRPGGFRPFLGRSVRSITDRSFPAAEVFDEAVCRWGDRLGSGAEAEAVVSGLDAALSEVVPEGRQPCEDVVAIAERVIADPSVTRVDAAAAGAGMSTRQLERRFRDAIGVHPKWVIRRARLHEAAERVRHGAPVEWAALAVELGFSDQAHLTRAFRDAYGVAPDAYARACAEAAASAAAEAAASSAG